MNRYSPIGVFDSGIGGLSVVKRISAYLPCENIIYFGDTARVPYGSKSNETVIEYSKQDARFLIKRNVKLIIVACNTASSVAIDVLRKTYKIPVYVLADSRKILNKKYFPQSVLGTFIGKEEKSGDEIWKNAPENVDVVFNYIEEVPNKFISKFILEKEALTPDELVEKIDKVLVANFF